MFLSRKSLLHEIKATKDVLMSSLKNVQDLEVESRRVPQLEARIDDLEKLIPIERFHISMKNIYLQPLKIFSQDPGQNLVRADLESAGRELHAVHELRGWRGHGPGAEQLLRPRAAARPPAAAAQHQVQGQELRVRPRLPRGLLSHPLQRTLQRGVRRVQVT